MRVELIYDRDCPNVERARSQLREAMEQAGRTPEWTEWDSADPSSPDYARRHGSPTILVNGIDVAGVLPTNSPQSCRVYAGEGSLEGVPSVMSIAAALKSAKYSGGVLASLTAVPAVIVGFLPSVICPACWPVYAGLLSSLGLGFLIESRYLMLTMCVLLTLAIISLAISGRKRHGYGPFLLGMAGGLVLLLGKFAIALDALVYGGIGLLVAASFWNAWPLPKRKTGACGSCRPVGLNVSIEAGQQAGKE